METETMKVKNPLVVVFMLFTFTPLGLYWMYRKTKWPAFIKKIITGSYVLMTLFTLMGFI